MSDYIPEDCWPEILKRLPVKSLARFRCVCRGWNALISSSSFIADHLACSKSKPRLFVNDVYHSEEKSCVIFDSDSSSAAAYIPHIMPRGTCSYELVGSAKGIICFQVDYSVYPERRCGIVLWNPVINKCIKLPDEAPTHSRVSLAIAIGVKPSEEDDLRVLKLSSNCSDPWANAATVAKIYSVRQGAWRVLHTNTYTPCRWDLENDSGLNPYIDGGVHWVANEYNAGPYKLIRFGFEEEEFSCITLPDVLADSFHSDLDVGVCCGRLALFQLHCNYSTFSIWTRGGNEDSWSVIISIDLGVDFEHRFVQYGVTHDGQILMLRKDGGHDLVLYNPTRKSFCGLDMQAAWDLVKACPFVESLVFMDGEGGALNLPPPLPLS